MSMHEVHATDSAPGTHEERGVPHQAKKSVAATKLSNGARTLAHPAKTGPPQSRRQFVSWDPDNLHSCSGDLGVTGRRGRRDRKAHDVETVPDRGVGGPSGARIGDEITRCEEEQPKPRLRR
jgi:hypothetical protein